MPHASPPRSAAARASVPLEGHCWPVHLQKTLRHSKAGLAQTLWGLWVLVCTRFCISKHLWWVWGFILNTILPLLPSCWGVSFVLGRGVSPQSHSPAAQPPWSLRSSTYHLAGPSLPLDVGYLLTVDPTPTHLKRPWCWERLKAGGEGDDRGWHGWVASPTQWTWVWVSSGSWRWPGRPGVLQSMGSQRVEHNWATELNWSPK